MSETITFIKKIENIDFKKKMFFLKKKIFSTHFWLLNCDKPFFFKLPNPVSLCEPLSNVPNPVFLCEPLSNLPNPVSLCEPLSLM